MLDPEPTLEMADVERLRWVEGAESAVHRDIEALRLNEPNVLARDFCRASMFARVADTVR